MTDCFCNPIGKIACACVDSRFFRHSAFVSKTDFYFPLFSRNHQKKLPIPSWNQTTSPLICFAETRGPPESATHESFPPASNPAQSWSSKSVWSSPYQFLSRFQYLIIFYMKLLKSSLWLLSWQVFWAIYSTSTAFKTCELWKASPLSVSRFCVSPKPETRTRLPPVTSAVKREPRQIGIILSVHCTSCVIRISAMSFWYVSSFHCGCLYKIAFIALQWPPCPKTHEFVFAQFSTLGWYLIPKNAFQSAGFCDAFLQWAAVRSHFVVINDAPHWWPVAAEWSDVCQGYSSMSAGSPPKILPSCVSQNRSLPDDFALFSVIFTAWSKRPPFDTCCESEVSPVFRYQYETTGSACFGKMHSRNWIA